jgi:hypothetical protein
MENRPYNEKDEKDEKEVDKHEEKSAEEKWRRDPLGSITWAAILIWAGLVLLADNLGMLKALTLPFYQFLPERFLWLNPGVWSVILIGAGVIVLIEVVLRLLMPALRQHVGSNLVLAAFLIGAGLGNIYGWNLVWPFVLIAIGLGVLLRGFTRRS